MSYDIQFSCISHVGKLREVNQDNFICDGRYLDPESEKMAFPLSGVKTSNQKSLFGVFDGMGGEECGEVASLIASKVAADLVLGDNPVQDLKDLCQKANDEICNYTKEHDLSCMGTTAATLVFDENGITLCNIGDSPVFRLHKGSLAQLSQDHVAVAPYGRKPPLSQHLGIPPEELIIEPYFAQGGYEADDVYLICSDGLTDMVKREQIEKILSEHEPEEAIKVLLAQALDHGGKDNITIIICKILPNLKQRGEGQPPVRKQEPDVIASAQPQNTSGKAKLGIAVAAGVLALAIVLTILFFSSAAYAVSRCVKEDDYEQALKTYRQDIRGNVVQETLLNMLLKDSVKEVVSAYGNGDMTLVDAVDALKTLDDMHIENAGKEARELVSKYVDKLKASVSSGAMTDEEVMTALKLLEELGFKGVDIHRTEVQTAYANYLSYQYESGKLEYKDVVGKLAALVGQGCDEAETVRSQIMIDYAQKILAQYEKGELVFDAVAAILTDLKNDGCSEAQELMDQIIAAQNADKIMKQADDHYDQGEYRLAIEAYATIPKSSNKYAEAQEKLNQACADYIGTTLTKAQQEFEAKNYAQVIALIDETCNALPDTVDTAALDALKAECIETCKTEALTAAEVLVAKGEYRDAIDALEVALMTLPDDADLKAKVTQYSQEYISKSVATATALAAEEKYVQALAILDEIKADYPDNEQINQAITDITTTLEAQPDTAKNPNKNPVPPKESEEHEITGGSDRENAELIVTEDVYHASLAKSGETDWYQFTTSENYSAYRIELVNNSINTTVYMTIYDGNDQELKQVSAEKGGTASLDIALTANTEYWIKVHPHRNNRTGNYQLTVKEKICDAGMSKADAFYVDLNEEYTKELAVYAINDWYRFKTTENYATYQFALTNNSVDCNIYLTVFDENDAELGSVYVGKGDSTTLDLILKASREYTVQISRYDDARIGSYQMSVNEMICDSGLTQAEAVPLNINETLQGKADTRFDEWYSITFEKAGKYTIKLTNNNVDSLMYAVFYDASGKSVGSISTSCGGTETHIMEMTAGIVMYVKVSRYYSDQFGDYTILVSVR